MSNHKLRRAARISATASPVEQHNADEVARNRSRFTPRPQVLLGWAGNYEVQAGRVVPQLIQLPLMDSVNSVELRKTRGGQMKWEISMALRGWKREGVKHIEPDLGPPDVNGVRGTLRAITLPDGELSFHLFHESVFADGSSECDWDAWATWCKWLMDEGHIPYPTAPLLGAMAMEMENRISLLEMADRRSDRKAIAYAKLAYGAIVEMLEQGEEVDDPTPAPRAPRRKLAASSASVPAISAEDPDLVVEPAEPEAKPAPKRKPQPRKPKPADA